MSQITSGIRGILSHPFFYNTLQILLGAKKARREYVEIYIRPSQHDKILDIGCGTAEILNFLPTTVEYFGFDLNNDYIKHAKNKFKSRGNFFCKDINNFTTDLPQFDIILANGVLHHLNDNESIKLFNTAAACLNKAGRMITLDCCYMEKQSFLAKFFINQDRGQDIRTPEGYQTLAKNAFNELSTHIKHDLLRIPYTHCIMECKNL